MDAIYQALKNFIKSFVNLFVAIVELFAGLINGLAALLMNICPRPGIAKSKAAETDKEKAVTADAELICQIRKELENKITDRDTYIMARTEVEVFESSIIRRAFAGRKRKFSNAVTKVLLEEEFRERINQQDQPVTF